MVDITPDMARAELAKRELDRRGVPYQEQQSQPEESFMSKLPRNVSSGLAQMGHEVINAPRDLTRLLENALGGMGKKIQKEMPGPKTDKASYPRISDLIPTQKNYNFAEMLGQKGPGTGMDRFIQGASKYLPDILSMYGIGRMAARELPHMTQRGGVRRINEAAEMFGEIPPVPNTEHLVDVARPYLDNTRETQRMLQDALSGEHEPLFSTASQLGKESRSLQRSPNASERRIFREPQEARQDILNTMRSHALSHGRNDASDMLTAGLNDYRRYVHFRDNVVPILKAIGIPTSGVALAGGAYKLGKKATKSED